MQPNKTQLSDIEFDREHIWHPYTSMINPLPSYQVASAKGVRIKLEDGCELIDGMSSWWCAVHGYNHPRLNRAAESQLQSMSHVMFGGLTHKPAINLARRLVEMTPEGLDRVFFCDSGSVSVEVAVKMALQYNIAKGMSQRNKIATIRGGYHGDTWHAMSVCDPVGGMHSIYSGRLPEQIFVERPECRFDQEWSDHHFAPMEQMISQSKGEIAAVIVEPIVQGAGGMWFYHPEYLRKLRALCDKEDILLIADEIATGFGRTGKMFGCDWAEIIPDIMTLGKAITGGYMSFAAVMATSDVALTISSGDPAELMHGPTFMANPLASAVACESLDMITESSTLERVANIEQILKRELQVAESLHSVKDIRVLGAIGVLEMHEPVNMASLQRSFVEAGIWVRPFGRLVYIMPPYIITEDDLNYLCRQLLRVLTDAASHK